MRKLVFVLFVFFTCMQVHSAVLPGINNNSNTISLHEPAPGFFDLSKMKVKNLEKMLGRKLKFKEKLALKYYQWRQKKGLPVYPEETKSDKGKTAMILGIIAIASLWVPYLNIGSIPCAILAIIFGNEAKRANPKDSRAKTGVILGWITLGLIILALALVIVLLSTWSFGGWG